MSVQICQATCVAEYYPHHRQRRRLLRTHSKWPRRRRAAEQRDELAAPHVDMGAPSHGAAADHTSKRAATAAVHLPHFQPAGG